MELKPDNLGILPNPTWKSLAIILAENYKFEFEIWKKPIFGRFLKTKKVKNCIFPANSFGAFNSISLNENCLKMLLKNIILSTNVFHCSIEASKISFLQLGNFLWFRRLNYSKIRLKTENRQFWPHHIWTCIYLRNYDRSNGSFPIQCHKNISYKRGILFSSFPLRKTWLFIITLFSL